jgi:cyclic pyranopterin phosphate synthase
MKKPQLRVMLTDKCNLSCVHCRVGGEGIQSKEKQLNDQELKHILMLCAEAGFTHVKFTGGEPLLRPSAVKLISETIKAGIFEDVQLVTNGHLLLPHIKDLKKSGVSLLTLSLDAVDKSKYFKIRGSNPAPAFQSLKMCHEEGIQIRINMIVNRSTYDQIPLMLNVANRFGCSLKLLDLICLQGENAWHYWRREYVNFDRVRDFLKNEGATSIGIEEAPGGIGAPLTIYKMPTGVEVLLKDSTRGTFYHSSCKDCRYYPCQDAIISVRLTADGYLKKCLIRDDNLELLTHDDWDDQRIRNSIKNILNVMCESVYEPFKWKPENLQQPII